MRGIDEEGSRRRRSLGSGARYVERALEAEAQTAASGLAGGAPATSAATPAAALAAGPEGVAGPSAARRRSLVGYVMVTASFLVMGSIGALVDYATAPESMLLVLRFATAGVVVGIVFARRRPLAGLRAPGVPLRLLLMGALDSATLLLFFLALRHTSVAIGMFLEFMAPVWVALVAPRVLHAATDAVVYPALALALGGLAVILIPTLSGQATHVTALGMLFGVASGFGYASFQMVVKNLTNRGVGSVTIVFSETVLNVVFLLPLALWQTIGAGYHLTGRDLVVGVILGVLCTAFAYTIWTEGVSRIRVQHSSILGYLEPVSAPLYALLLLGERPSAWTLGGGALILVAGALVVAFGRAEEAAA
jgi:drug/metabolite transporter (DMT)-like permease